MAKILTTGWTRIAVTVYVIICLFGMYADKMAADCILFHGRVLTQVALVNLFTCLTESMYA